MNKVHEPCVYFHFQVKFMKKNIILRESLNKYSCAIAVIAYYDNSISSLTRLNKRQRKPKGQSIMDKLETQPIEKTQGAISNGRTCDTGNSGRKTQK